MVGEGPRNGRLRVRRLVIELLEDRLRADLVQQGLVIGLVRIREPKDMRPAARGLASTATEKSSWWTKYSRAESSAVQ